MTYETPNQLATKAAPGEATASYGYDAAGRLVSASDTSAALPALPAGSASYQVSYVYDARNRLTGAVWPTAIAATVPPAAAVTFGHGYDPTDRRISLTATDASWLAYPQAVAGMTSYSVNALNQYTAIGSVTPSYDGNGDLTFDGTVTYGYDAEGRLTSVAQGGSAVASYAFDAQGRRKSKTTGGTTTIFVTDADNREVLEYDGASGQVGRWFAYGLGVTDLLGEMDVAAGARVTLVPDLQGSIIASLDAGSGALTKYGYLPFGESPISGGTFRYAGLRIDPETHGLYYARARTYAPVLGRFLQPDPIGPAVGVNLYAYGNNDPLNNIDPQGLFTLQLGISLGGTILGFVVPQIGFGFAIDHHGNIGTYAFGGVGAGIGVQAGAGGSVQFSNAQTIYDLSGPFANTSVHGGVGVGGSVDFFTGTSRNGQDQVTGGGITLGASTGASASLTTTSTLVCGSQGCVGSPLPQVNGSLAPPAMATNLPASQNVSFNVKSTASVAASLK